MNSDNMEVTGQLLTDTVDAGSTHGAGILCQPCQSDGEEMVAVVWCKNCQEYFCQGCVKFHRKQAISKHHVVLEGDAMPKDLSLASDECGELCTTHTRELVTFYCKTHDVVGCGECKKSGHKGCERIAIKDAAGDYTITEIQTQVDQLRKDINVTKQNIDREKQGLFKNHEQIIGDINSYIKSLNDYLVIVQSRLHSQANDLKALKERHLKETETTLAALETEMDDMVKALTAETDDQDRFVKAKRAEKRFCEARVELILLDDNVSTQHHTFKGDMMLMERMQDEDLLGEVVPITPTPDFTRPKYIGEIAINQPNDTVCYITDMVQIKTDVLVLVDRNNTSLKIVNVENNEIVYVFSFINRPFGITKVSWDLVAVTVPAARKIQFLSYNNKDLTQRYSLDVGGECIGIDCKNDLLALTYSNPSKAEILTLTGTVLHTIRVANIQLPSYVVFGHERYTVIISHFHRGYAKVYSFDGKCIDTYNDGYLRHPAGLVTTKYGVILLCNVREDVSSIVQVEPYSEDMCRLNNVIHVQPGLDSPRCLCACEDTRKLYVCNGPGGLAKNCNSLKMYQC